MGSAEKKSNASDILIRTMSQKKTARKFAVCVNNSEYPASLELHKIYRVVPDPDAIIDGDLRIIDESGEDYLYPAAWFVFIELPPAVERSLRRAA
jgi:hypothetical protein